LQETNLRWGIGMSRCAAERIVQFLAFSSSGPGVDALNTINSHQWNRTFQWLNDSGLAFYFLHRLKTQNATGTIPEPLLFRLRADFAANQKRMADLFNRMRHINAQFQNSGLRFAVLKGFSLVPDYCPDISLRQQGDLDYLIDQQSLGAACRILTDMGYLSKQTGSSKERLFFKPGTVPRSRGSEQYSSRAPHAVELHLDIWDGELLRLPSVQRQFTARRVVMKEIEGTRFPALDDADAFLIQVLHAMSHVFSHWIKVGSLLEIAFFLNQRASDARLWEMIEQRVGCNAELREFVVVVSESATQLFDAPLPQLVQTWTGQLRPGARVWIDRYSCKWVLSELPVHEIRFFATSKLSVFLHQQYRGDPVQPADGSPAPSAWRPSRIAFSLRRNPSLILNLQWWKQHKLARRCVYYGFAWLRYFCEVPRWLWLNGMRFRPERLPHSGT
jgi:hypothetical protein